ncbi:uncharacterized protein STAUR_7944 [Stigmatella aurantiaca DW4/3-1]|uniref:Uncharacterized protein n=1 Tax=Stigmatella aurantiaca (strain DW4/3-1) TaxID=378806 RepID=E3FPZ6_STIAD|nr:uncharacterized protein STAUR_7944 [Stigmatella aurantiaca DW4/3-1]
MLHLLLGLVSASRRLEAQMLPASLSAPQQVPAAPLDATQERQVLVLLGVLSMRRTVMGLLEPLRQTREAAPSRPAEPPAEPLNLRALLR